MSQHKIYSEDLTISECDSCGYVQIIPHVDSPNFYMFKWHEHVINLSKNITILECPTCAENRKSKNWLYFNNLDEQGLL